MTAQNLNQSEYALLFQYTDNSLVFKFLTDADNGI